MIIAGFALKRLAGPFLVFPREFLSKPLVRKKLRLSHLGAAQVAVRLPNDTMGPTYVFGYIIRHRRYKGRAKDTAPQRPSGSWSSDGEPASPSFRHGWGQRAAGLTLSSKGSQQPTALRGWSNQPTTTRGGSSSNGSSADMLLDQEENQHMGAQDEFSAQYIQLTRATK